MMENTIGGLVTGTCTVGPMLQGNELCAILCYLLIRLRIICCVPVLYRLYNQPWCTQPRRHWTNFGRKLFPNNWTGMPENGWLGSRNFNGTTIVLLIPHPRLLSCHDGMAGIMDSQQGRVAGSLLAWMSSCWPEMSTIPGAAATTIVLSSWDWIWFWKWLALVRVVFQAHTHPTVSVNSRRG